MKAFNKVLKVVVYIVLIVGISVYFSKITTEASRLWRFAQGRVDFNTLIPCCAFVAFGTLNYACMRILFKKSVWWSLIYAVPVALFNVLIAVSYAPIYKG